MSWQDIFGKYPIDYILWDKKKTPDLLLDAVIKELGDNIEEAYNREGAAIYRFFQWVLILFGILLIEFFEERLFYQEESLANFNGELF